MFAAMVEPSAIEATSEDDVDADNLGDEAEEDIEDDLDLELIDIESIED